MLANNIIEAMLHRGALKVQRQNYEGNIVFDINYKIVEEEFPGFLEELVYTNLRNEDKELYDNGYIAYLVRPDGLLEWKATRKLHNYMRELYAQRMLQYPYG